MKKIQVRDLAPEFTWTATAGEQVRLSDFRHQQVVVLFYRPTGRRAIGLQLAAHGGSPCQRSPSGRPGTGSRGYVAGGTNRRSWVRGASHGPSKTVQSDGIRRARFRKVT
jgi:hypothetical protein